MKFFCGNPVCKRELAVVSLQNVDSRGSFACPMCGITLYPQDILDSLPSRERESGTAPIMSERDGRRVPLCLADLPDKSALAMYSPANVSGAHNDSSALLHLN